MNKKVAIVKTDGNDTALLKNAVQHALEDGTLVLFCGGAMADAILDYRLRLFIMTPEAPADLYARLQTNELGDKIWSGLGGYFQWPLLRMFPGDQSETAEWQAFKAQYFEGRIRCL